MDNNSIKSIAILGGTGKEGMGLGYRWAKAGYKIIIGSRRLEKAKTAEKELLDLCEKAGVKADVLGIENPDAATQGDIIVLTVPFSAHVPMLESIAPYCQGKIFIDVTVPIVPPKVTKVQMPDAGSASMEAKQILGEDVKVVAAFQNISYENLLHQDVLDCDVLVCGDTKDARATVLELVRDAGMVGFDAGPLENAVVVEGMTSILIGINKKFGVEGSGIQITGVPRT